MENFWSSLADTSSLFDLFNFSERNGLDPSLLFLWALDMFYAEYYSSLEQLSNLCFILLISPPPCANRKVWASDAREGESLLLPTRGNAAVCRLRYCCVRCTKYRFSSSQRTKTWTNLSEYFSYESVMQKCMLMTFLFSLPLPTPQMQGMTLLSPIVFLNKTYTCLREETSELRKRHARVSRTCFLNRKKRRRVLCYHPYCWKCFLPWAAAFRWGEYIPGSWLPPRLGRRDPKCHLIFSVGVPQWRWVFLEGLSLTSSQASGFM